MRRLIILMAFAIVLSKSGPRTFGGNRQFYHDNKSTELVISGPSETGKTFAACSKLHFYSCIYPKCQSVIIRQVRADMAGTVLQTFGKTIQRAVDEKAVEPYGKTDPYLYQYWNGSQIWVAGMDRPGKALSSERDFAYVNQAEELSKDAWEIITSRVTGRAGNAPIHQVMGDANPGPPTHWMLARERFGSLKMYTSRHEDNPRLYDHQKNEWTAAGKETLRILDQLTGVRYLRLRKGIWAGAEGLIYDEWDPVIHIIDRFEIPADWDRYISIDFGFTNPMVVSWWAKDGDGRLFRYREIYKTKLLVEDAARWAKELSGSERIVDVICDHDAEDRATWTRHFGDWTTPAKKDISSGIQSVQTRLRKGGDGKPRLSYLKNSLVHPPDPELEAKNKPTCTEQEYDSYAWDEKKTAKEVPIKENDHGMDQTRYLCRTIDDEITLEFH